MKATDFNLSKDLKFNAEKGITSFQNSRMVIFDANAIGLLRQALIDMLGTDKAREFFLKFGYQHGFSDFLQMKVAHRFESEMELLAAGPVIHTWEGIVHAAPTEIEYNREKGTFFFTGIWSNSYEAEQQLSYNECGDLPVCWSLMGYASGWCTAFFGKPLIAIEPECMGMGDDTCAWKIQPPDVWGEEANIYEAAYQEFWEDYHG